jgi:superfamily II DNA or RNA helicase
LTSSVGLGKSYVAAQIAKYFLTNDKKVVIIAPAGLVHNADQWPRYLKEFEIYDKVTLISMGELQKSPETFRHQTYSRNFGLIVVDEAHNYRSPDAYRTRNLKKIIDENGDSKILFLTATPINTSLDDLLNLVNLFHRKGSNLLFDSLVRKLGDLISLFKEREYEELTASEKEELSQTQEEIEKEMFVKSTRETIKTEADYIEELQTFSGIDIRKISDPEIKEAKYELDSRYEDVVNGIVDFITQLTAAHLRLLDPEKGVRLGGFFKWILYKRFESDISSYYLTLRRVCKRNSLILTAVEKRDVEYLEEEDSEDDVEIGFNIDFKEKLAEVIEKIKSGKGWVYTKILEELRQDIANLEDEINKLEPFLEENSKILFKKDQKLNELHSCIEYNTDKKILIFTEYKDTLKAIKEYFKNLFSTEEVRFVDSTTDNRQTIIGKFNNPKDSLRILISTDALSEGFNISGADLVINFDIPYNPVRIIQRIGRATRLDNPKEIEVLNFRPADVLDVELRLVERMELRIKDIIRFVGVEYRIWFETEKELLKERRVKDKRIYLDVLQKIRGNLRAGNFKDLDVSINYSKPVLIFLQKAIQRYTIKKNDLENVTIPTKGSYTLFKGEKGLCVIFKGSNSFNEDVLLNKDPVELAKRADFESLFKLEIASFEDFKSKTEKEELKMQFFNDNMDKIVNGIIDYISTEKLNELYPNAAKLEDELSGVRTRCGSNTSKILRRIKTEIRDQLTNEKIEQWIDELENSFSKSEIQKKLVGKKEPLLAIGFTGESL